MDRRIFIFSLGAIAATPAISITSPAVVTGVTARRYANAKIIARAHNLCSPAMLQRLMQVDAAVATELNTMLLNRGVITAAGSDGIAMAMKPTNTNCVPTQALKRTNLTQAVTDMREKVRAFVQDTAPNKGDTDAKSAPNADHRTALHLPPAAPHAS